MIAILIMENEKEFSYKKYKLYAYNKNKKWNQDY